MSPEKDKYLVETYPLLYKDRYGDMKSTAMCWGFECDDGWFDIINELSAKLSADPNNTPIAKQVKEKFGTLRFYVEGATEEQYNLINETESESAITCEICGKPGELIGFSWVKTRCKEHRGEGK